MHHGSSLTVYIQTDGCDIGAKMMCEYELIYCLTTVGRVMVFGLNLDAQRSTDVGLSNCSQFGELVRLFVAQVRPEIVRLIHQIVIV